MKQCVTGMRNTVNDCHFQARRHHLGSWNIFDPFTGASGATTHTAPHLTSIAKASAKSASLGRYTGPMGRHSSA